MGIPPEVDVFEHFRKDGFLTRFHITHSFHQGPTYENNTVVQQKYWRLWPLDLKYIEIEFVWKADGMTWTVNGKKTMQIPGNSPKFPTHPMNLIMNAGLGPDWNPKPEKFDDFIIREASYYRDSAVL
jgi:beta-glucanase (GH16 family)